jgi:hypothetical protein
VVETASLPAAGGAWSPPKLISEVGQNADDPDVAIDPEGNRVAVWDRSDGANTIVQAAPFDAAGPRIRSLSIPAAGTENQPVFLRVDPLDVWTPIAAIAWNLGDGDGAFGATVEHTYRKPGTYPIRVVAFDSIAMSRAAAGSITIYPRARAGRFARVRGRHAELRVFCPSPAGCEGEPRLIAGFRTVRQHRTVGVRRAVGATAFTIPEGSTTVELPLSRKGLARIRSAGKRGVKAQLSGPGIKHRIVVLIGPRKRKR